MTTQILSPEDLVEGRTYRFRGRGPRARWRRYEFSWMGTLLEPNRRRSLALRLRNDRETVIVRWRDLELVQEVR